MKEDEILKIFADCTETDWRWTGEDEIPIDEFNKNEAAKRIVEKFNGFTTYLLALANDEYERYEDIDEAYKGYLDLVKEGDV